MTTEERDAHEELPAQHGAKKSLHIYVFADVICPWCWIGQRRLRRVLSERDDLDISANWRPFQLNPHAPLEGESWQDVIETKFGGIARARESWAAVEQAGESEGLKFRFDLITRFPNSRRAHELVLLSETHGRTWATVEALCQANFAEGLDISDVDTLLEIAGAVGLDRTQAAEVFADERYARAVMSSQREAASIGISGVPFFVLNGKFGISGAQPEDVFRRGIEQASNATLQQAEASRADTDS